MRIVISGTIAINTRSQHSLPTDTGTEIVQRKSNYLWPIDYGTGDRSLYLDTQGPEIMTRNQGLYRFLF